MGQRLNIEFASKGETIANCYYHWSAYSHEALNLTQELVEVIKDRRVAETDIELAIRAFEATGAGVNPKEQLRIQQYDSLKNLEIKKTTDRNNGLISLTQKGIEETRFWEEGRVTINLDTNTFDFKVYLFYTKEEWEEDMQDFEGSLALFINPEQFSGIPFDQIYALFDLINDHSGVIFGDGSVALWIG